jgi:hypothetical protein
LPLLAITAAPVQAAAVTVCRGDDSWPRGKPKCKRATTVTVAATASNRDDACTVMREFKRGTIAICVGHFVNQSYNNRYCGLYLRTDGEVDMLKLHPHGQFDNSPVEGDELTGEDTGLTRGHIAFVVRNNAVSQPAMDFITAGGYVITIEDALVSWDYGGIAGCHASARISARQR